MYHLLGIFSGKCDSLLYMAACFSIRQYGIDRKSNHVVQL